MVKGIIDISGLTESIQKWYLYGDNSRGKTPKEVINFFTIDILIGDK